MNHVSRIRRHARPLWMAATIVAATSALTACVVEPVRPRLVSEVAVQPRFMTETAVAIQPPPPREEIVGIAPQPGYLWAPGYWNWEGGRHVWVGGRWMAPRAGYYWESPTPGCTSATAGTCARATGRVAERPAPARKRASARVERGHALSAVPC